MFVAYDGHMKNSNLATRVRICLYKTSHRTNTTYDTPTGAGFNIEALTGGSGGTSILMDAATVAAPKRNLRRVK